MQLLPSLQKGVLAGVLLLLCLPACVLVVDDDDLFNDHLHRHRWRLDVVVYYGRTYAADEPFTISFERNGDFAGRADCNNYDGFYTSPRNGVLSVREIYSEDEACGRRSIDGEFFEVLSGASTYRLRGDELIITARNGDKLYFYTD